MKNSDTYSADSVTTTTDKDDRGTWDGRNATFEDSGPPSFALTPRRIVIIALFVVVSIGGLYYILPQLAGLDQTWHRVKGVNPAWLGLALLFTLGCYGGYVMLFRSVFAPSHAQIRWRESYQITMAGLAASRIFSAGGAGGIALTAWAVRRSGMSRRAVAVKTISFLVLIHGVYIAAVVFFGLALYFGAFGASHPLPLTLLPAVIGVIIIIAALAMTFVSTSFQHEVGTYTKNKDDARSPSGRPTQPVAADGEISTNSDNRDWGAGDAATSGAGDIATSGDRNTANSGTRDTKNGARESKSRWGRIVLWLSYVPAAISAGMRDSYRHIIARDPSLFGAIAFWAFQIGVLWVAFEALGGSPSLGVLVMAFFIGMLGNLLPMPGGVGGVDGGLIGAFVAFGVDTGLAVVAVLVYRAFIFWLPTIPGIIAYLQLRKTVQRWQQSQPPNAAASPSPNAAASQPL